MKGLINAMKDVTMFMFAGCPHCARAAELMKELCEENPGFREVRVETVDEKKEPERADQYDYYYVPTYYVGGEKLHEGVPTKEAIRKVYEAACE
jgi:glutaredoxin